MKPILVTGGNGHVGNNLCRLLVSRGERVRAMMRPSADAASLNGVDVEIVRGDILDAESTERAVEGCDRVYHTAAGFLIWSRDPERDIVRPCVEGTRNVMRAAVRAGVEKIVYTSTGGTIGVAESADHVADERQRASNPHTDYFRAKIAAEDEALAIGAREKLPTTVINPGFILGPGFFKLSESVQQVSDFVNYGAPIYFDGGVGVVDVEDVGRGAMGAMEKGRDGERYILSGENVTWKELLDLVAECTGLKPPSLRVPIPVLRALALIMELGGWVTGRRPQITRSAVDEFAGKYGYMDCTKAKEEVGFSYRSARETVRRTVAWLLEQGFVSEKRQRALKPRLQ
jgi:dihydroflavonol-4-reductase